MTGGLGHPSTIFFRVMSEQLSDPSLPGQGAGGVK
jgi:hypothetical protein